MIITRDKTIQMYAENEMKLEAKITDLEKRNEELKALIAHKNGYTQQLEQDLYENASNCVIPKQKIKDKIEELNKKEKRELKGLKGQDRYYIKQQYMYKKNVLEELLEEEN